MPHGDARDYILKHFPQAQVLTRANAHKRLKDLFVKEQGGLCPVCGEPLADTNEGKGDPNGSVLDHDYSTGQCRGVLHRDCNISLGRVETALNRGQLRRMLQYLKRGAEVTNRPLPNPIRRTRLR